MPTEPDKSARLFENKLDGTAAEMLKRSHHACRLAARRASTTIYPGLRLLPEPRRSAAIALYTWKRRVDDAADTDGLVESRRVELARLRDMTARTHAGRPPSNSEDFWLALGEVFATCDIPLEWLEAVLDGADWDLARGVIRTEQELELYCYRVASTVMMALVRIVGLAQGADEGAALDLAKKRGLALQLTDIVRDFGEDYDSYPRRQYIPAEAFQAAGLKPNAMRVWMPEEQCERLALEWIELAEGAYASSEGLEGLLDPGARRCVRLMTALGRETLAELRRHPSRMVRGGPAGVSAARRTRLGLATRFTKA
ncbi:MAG: phytoene/squalene synthase family protein [Phycisphaerales bacterium JB040]